jgi:hypothetical protein
MDTCPILAVCSSECQFCLRCCKRKLMLVSSIRVIFSWAQINLRSRNWYCYLFFGLHLCPLSIPLHRVFALNSALIQLRNASPSSVCERSTDWMQFQNWMVESYASLVYRQWFKYMMWTSAVNSHDKKRIRLCDSTLHLCNKHYDAIVERTSPLLTNSDISVYE